MLWSSLRRPQRSTLHCLTVTSGGSRGGSRGTQPPLIFGPNGGPKGREKVFETGPPPLSHGLDDRPPPPPPLICRSGSATGYF